MSVDRRHCQFPELPVYANCQMAADVQSRPTAVTHATIHYPRRSVSRARARANTRIVESEYLARNVVVPKSPVGEGGKERAVAIVLERGSRRENFRRPTRPGNLETLVRETDFDCPRISGFLGLPPEIRNPGFPELQILRSPLNRNIPNARDRAV